LTDILCINETEAQIIIGLEDTIESEEQIQNAMTDLLKKCHTVIITLGGKGAAIATREAPKASCVKAEKVDKVVGTTGAGDSFAGSMAFYMANFANLDLEEIVRRYCNIASISVTKEGTQPSFPNKSQLLPVEKFF
jgi:ribokinase